MARPTDYREEFLLTARGYIDNFAEKGDVVPTVEGLADELGFGRKTLYNWANQHPEFQEVIDLLMSKQGRLLQAKGLRKETDASITKLMLSANHGMAEKSEQKSENTGTIEVRIRKD